MTIITLLHCLHVVLQHREESADNEVDPPIGGAARWASLPNVTAILLENTHTVLVGLDSLNLLKVSKAFKS